MSIPIFFSYSHKDEHYKKAFETHLSILQKQGQISIWSDRKIMLGDNWKEEINLNIQNAKIIFLLISSNFLASEYCYDTETIYALEQHEKGKAIVIPLILKPCLWEKSNFKHLQVCPENGKPISTWKNKDQAWLNVSEQIISVIDKINSRLKKEQAEFQEKAQTQITKEQKINENLMTGAAIGSVLFSGIEPVVIGGYLRNLSDSRQLKAETLEVLLVRFLSTFNSFYFSSLRIQKWGSKQWSFEKFEFHSVKEIRTELEKLYKSNKVQITISKMGNRIYKIL